MNPKDRIGGSNKLPALSVLPVPVLAEVSAVALLGAQKYGRHNWRRDNVHASVYVDAAVRHIMSWWESDENDSDSNVSHLAHAICGLMILRDCQMRGGMVDDRPPGTPDFMDALNAVSKAIRERFPDAPGPVTAENTPGKGRRGQVVERPDDFTPFGPP